MRAVELAAVTNTPVDLCECRQRKDHKKEIKDQGVTHVSGKGQSTTTSSCELRAISDLR
jgi:hypothetical protein